MSLTGTWETAPIPLARVRLAYVAAGGQKRAAGLFAAQLHATTAVQFRIEVTDRAWREYVRADGGEAVPGWSGTYTREGSTIRASDESLRCDITFAVRLDGKKLRVQVLQDVGGRRDCGAADLVDARAIHSAAPYVRTAPGR